MTNIIKYRAKHPHGDCVCRATFSYPINRANCNCGAVEANAYFDALEEKLGKLFELVIEDEASSYELGKVIKEILELKYEE